MRNRYFLSLVLGTLVAGQVSVAAAGDKERDGLLMGLADRIFAVEAEILYADENSPFTVGDTFDNCYIFEEGNIWIDPLFPGPGMAVPGGWVQHTAGPRAKYTATIVDTVFSGAGLLTQTGTVYKTRGKSRSRLIAYTTAFVGAQPFVEIVSRGREIKKNDAATLCPLY